MTNVKHIHVLKHIVYACMLLLLYIVQTTPGLFLIRGAKPFWVIPAAVAIAMYEGEFAGGIYGAAAGILCDVGSVALFGYNGFIISLCCIAAGLLIIYLLRCNLMGCVLIVTVTVLIRGSVEFLFAYGMWAHQSVWKLYAFGTLPSAAYTVAVTPLVYGLVRLIHRRFAKAMER